MPNAPTQGLAANPLFGRPIWSYININRGPVAGPQPRLAKGSGRTGKPGYPGAGTQLPGYMSDNEYTPTVFTYDPVENPIRQKRLHPSLPVPGKDDGLRALNPPTLAHQVAIGNRFNHQMRSSYNWQTMEFPVNFRNLLSYQLARKYAVNSLVQQARPLPQSNYFFGYQVNPQQIDRYNQSTLGVL